MDFLDPKKRKSHQRRIFIGYGLIGLLVLIISGLLLLQAYGYSYNVRTGDISQNGLMFIGSRPVTSTVKLNGKNRGTTDQRLILPQGEYDLSLEREGYHSWQKSVSLKGGVIERFLYPFLFPVNLESSEVELYASQPSMVTQSPDRQWLVTHVPGSIDTFEVLNLSDKSPTPFRFQIPLDVITSGGAKHSYEFVEWSTDNRHLVIVHKFEGGSEHLLLDREQPTAARNLTKLIVEPFSELKLRDKKFDSYYLYRKSDNSLRRYDIDTALTAPVASNVLAYHPHGDDELLYVTDEGKVNSKTVKLIMVENGETFTVRELQKSDNYLVELARYEGAWYLVVYPSAEQKIYVFRNPVELLRSDKSAHIIPTTVLRVANAKHLSFSQDARFIAAQAGSKVGVYDAEYKRTYHYDTMQSLAKSSKFVWMDESRLTAVVEGAQKVFDFDGTNLQTLESGYNNSRPYFNRDYSAVYTIAPSKSVTGRTAIVRTELLVEKQ